MGSRTAQLLFVTPFSPGLTHQAEKPDYLLITGKNICLPTICMEILTIMGLMPASGELKEMAPV